MLAGLYLLQGWLDLCLDDPLGLRIDVEQEVAIAGAWIRAPEQAVVEPHFAGVCRFDGHPVHVALDLVLIGAGGS